MALWLLILLVQKYLIVKLPIVYEAALSVVLGMLLSACNVIRPVSNILIIAFLMCLVLVMLPKLGRRKWLIAGIMLVSYYGCSVFLTHQISLKAQIPVASLPIGFAFYVGTNPTPIQGELGLWNMEDAGKFSEMVNQYKEPQLSQNAALQAGVDRLRQIVNDNRLLHFLYLK